MAKFSKLQTGTVDIEQYLFECPGCGCAHFVQTKGRVRWEWNGSLDAPTVSPSLLVRGRNSVCHSFVRDGKIEFLADSTHSLAGQTVEIPEWQKGDNY